MLPARYPAARAPMRPAPAPPAAARRGWCTQARAEPPAASGGSGVSQEEMRRNMEELKNDPEMSAKIQDAVSQMEKDPAVAEQVKASQAAMASPEMQKAVAQLREDPEISQIFEEIQKGGMPVLMKYMQRPEIAQKIGEKMSKLNMPMPQAPGAAQAAAPVAAPEVTDLLTAARMGDEEATEDFIAVGKDVNEQDADGRTPAHFAAAHNATQVLQLLIDAGADLERTDTKDNTALHYAAGYGRVDIVDMLLDAGASVSAKNATGKRPLEVAKLNPDNPLLEEEDLVEKLSA